MNIVKPFKGAANIVSLWRRESRGARPWSLRWQPVCTSTELGLTQWLHDQPWSDTYPRALLAACQRRGMGQQGKVWQSLHGGVWISAALPSSQECGSGALFGLAVALAVAEQLECYELPVRIKWPNDLVLHGRKVAGVLPRLIYRGDQVRLARVGLGLNVCNPVPREGIALREILCSGHCRPIKWCVKVLCALDRSIEYAARKEWLLDQLERRLWADEVPDPTGGQPWEVLGLRNDGAIRLKRGRENTIWTRW